MQYNKEITIICCNNIAHYRHLYGLTQSQLANMVGVSKNCISDIERGLYSPSIKTAYLICLALDTFFEELFYFVKLLDND